MRLIDADNAISVLEILADKCANIREFEQAIGVLKDVPTIEPEPQWIPCSEKLPDKGLRVLMQLDNAWQIVGWYDKEDKQWFELVWGDPVANDRVLAWMELPQPYGEK